MIKSLNFNCLLPFCYKYITVEEHHKGRHTSWSVVFWSFSFEWASIMERLANRLTPLVSWSSPTNRWLTGDFSTSVGLTNSTTVISMLVVAIISGSWFEQLQTDIAEHFNPSLQLQQNYPKWAVGYNCIFYITLPLKFRILHATSGVNPGSWGVATPKIFGWGIVWIAKYYYIL